MCLGLSGSHGQCCALLIDRRLLPRSGPPQVQFWVVGWVLAGAGPGPVGWRRDPPAAHSDTGPEAVLMGLTPIRTTGGQAPGPARQLLTSASRSGSEELDPELDIGTPSQEPGRGTHHTHWEQGWWGQLEDPREAVEPARPGCRRVCRWGTLGRPAGLWLWLVRQDMGWGGQG